MGERVCSRDPVPVNHAALLRPMELTDDEMFRLMAAFTMGKTEILEDDAMTLVRWAQAQRFGAVVLEMVLAGDLIPTVDDGAVKVALSPRAAARRGN